MKLSSTCPIYKVLIGLLVVTREFLLVCSSAVDSCGKPCEPGNFCDIHLGFCVSCLDYCTGQNDCHTTCGKNKRPHLTTILPSITEPTSSQDIITAHPKTNFISTEASAAVIYPPSNTSISSGEGVGAGAGAGSGQTFVSSQGHSELSHGLVFGLFFIMFFLMIIIGYFVRYRKSLKMPNMCCISTRDSYSSADMELGAIDSRNRQGQIGREWNIVENPMVNETPVGHPTTSGYVPVQIDKVDDEDVINQSGPSGLNSPPRPDAEAANHANLVQPVSGSRSTPCHVNVGRPYQSASIQPPNARQEREILQRAIPSDHQPPKQKTPETHRKVTDGTLKGHELTIGASQFEPLFQPGDIPWNRDSGQGD